MNTQQSVHPEPSAVVSLPDGSKLRAVAYVNGDFPAISIYWEKESDAALPAPWRHFCGKAGSVWTA